jgi:tRNA(Ile2) C34 agmatinyltransferase TiaS
MSFLDSLKESQEEDLKEIERYTSKLGPYTGDQCPTCGRTRIMLGKDGKHRCEKCTWCVEDFKYDGDLI